MKTIIAAMLAAASSLANAAPTYKEADGVVRSITGFVAEGNLWAKKTQAQRIKIIQDARALQARSEKVFGADVLGPWRNCVVAMNLLQEYVGNLNDLSRAYEGTTKVADVQLLSPMHQAFLFGDHYRVCREQVETLDTSVAPRKP